MINVCGLFRLRRTETLTLYRVTEGRHRPEGVAVWQTLALRALLDGIDETVARFSENRG